MKTELILRQSPNFKKALALGQNKMPKIVKGWTKKGETNRRRKREREGKVHREGKL